MNNILRPRPRDFTAWMCVVINLQLAQVDYGYWDVDDLWEEV